MKPAPFDYVAPRTVEEAVDHLTRHGADARVLAGGQSLVRLMNTRLATPAVLVDINRIDGLDGIALENGSLRIGALARQRAAELSEVVHNEASLLAQASAHVAHASVRRRGTVVGSIAFADPSAELPAALLALDGEAIVTGPDSERTVAAADLFTGAFETSLREGELISAIRVPRRPDAGAAWTEVARREGDLPVCGAGALVTLDANGAIASARIALCGVGATPVRAMAVEEALTGAEPTEDAIVAAAERAARDLDPPSDPHGSAAYRRHLAVAMTRRSVLRAAERAREGAANA
ncbi:MAG TPA: FAD binding domain-containing protein [Solirubrobacteraceae bacterium]|nr:FAD binding domain-containing protein [Solirubrobacteraceae bacterium]